MDGNDFRLFLIIIIAVALFAGDPDLIDSIAEFFRNYNKG